MWSLMMQGNPSETWLSVGNLAGSTEKYIIMHIFTEATLLAFHVRTFYLDNRIAS